MQQEVSAVCEGYRAKTNPWIVMVSTPYKLGDVFETIDRDINSIFHKLSFHYTVGLNKIYNSEDIEKEKNQPLLSLQVITEKRYRPYHWQRIVIL